MHSESDVLCLADKTSLYSSLREYESRRTHTKKVGNLFSDLSIFNRIIILFFHCSDDFVSHFHIVEYVYNVIVIFKNIYEL